MDAFAMGSLLAIHEFKANHRHFWLSLAVLFLLGWINTLIFLEPDEQIAASGLFYRLPLEIGPQFVWGYSAINICCTIMVCAIAHRQLYPRFFEHPVVDYIGKISYPTYILNLPIIGFFAWLFTRFEIPIVPGSAWFVVVCLIPTFGLAALIHEYIEIPCNYLKNRWFAYRTRTAEEKAATRDILVPYQQAAGA